ncbi:succinylglutamate desuccinylase/aspartoacylase family protein [Adhaeretor mobilis]|uniref:Aspartoacylase n=1 Tax=Adhaeretor mobilis TaxID=1930276 RepID=A0A517N1I1_9BACT|nr:succinylglutamate desuccinylase/aspartoacylase family protein [Adhaeretor mobilis]QDT00999.1 aspartoacylase [Adhaeretor mobilis]
MTKEKGKVKVAAAKPRAAINEPVTISGAVVQPGERERLEIPVARLPTGTALSLPVVVVNGKRPGPTLWMSAAVHGDEVNGLEIIGQVLDRIKPRELAGTIIATPIVNVFGFNAQSRYLPDRRDLNRSFPGSSRGSLASRLAHLFMQEVVLKCQYGIDLHTGSNHRTNLPQIRTNLQDPESRRLAEAFAAPVIMHGAEIDGTLRRAATRAGIRTMVYEAGEPLRFDDAAIRLGRDGVLRVLAALGMRKKSPKKRSAHSAVVDTTRWVRARQSGILRLSTKLGAQVAEKEQIGFVADAFGDDPRPLIAPSAGIIIGHTNNPLVQQGEAVVHIASMKSDDHADEVAALLAEE